mmetsp:Transcript_48151/g.151066  ORF Transcript_48151/g.151066 Transcript_48151/m.151066 type:complete len:369 (+) Transcript_48151:163-1269(+)
MQHEVIDPAGSHGDDVVLERARVLCVSLCHHFLHGLSLPAVVDCVQPELGRFLYPPLGRLPVHPVPRLVDTVLPRLRHREVNDLLHDPAILLVGGVELVVVHRHHVVEEVYRPETLRQHPALSLGEGLAEQARGPEELVPVDGASEGDDADLDPEGLRGFLAEAAQKLLDVMGEEELSVGDETESDQSLHRPHLLDMLQESHPVFVGDAYEIVRLVLRLQQLDKVELQDPGGGNAEVKLVLERLSVVHGVPPHQLDSVSASSRMLGHGAEQLLVYLILIDPQLLQSKGHLSLVVLRQVEPIVTGRVVGGEVVALRPQQALQQPPLLVVKVVEKFPRSCCRVHLEVNCRNEVDPVFRVLQDGQQHPRLL